MPDPTPRNARMAPSAARNRDPILAALKQHLPVSGLVLEIAAGTGEHAVHCAAALPHLQWLPTDSNDAALASIAAWRDHAALPNLLRPLRLDASAPNLWLIKSANAIVNINMIHISPWSATLGLMEGAGRLLPAGGILFLYGPYFEPDAPTVQSNLDFDRNLKDKNPSWGVRNLKDVTAVASQHRLELSARVAMPANNLSVVFRKA